MALEILASVGNDLVARVYLARTSRGHLAECVDAVQPPRPRAEKWVLMVSVGAGCPVSCAMCDAGGYYDGQLSAEEILEQIDFLIRGRYAGGAVPARKFKIQFARTGDPAFNPAVLDVLAALPRRYDAPGLIPSISTIAPAGRETFFEGLRRVKDESYGGGRFQLQFSIHTTDPALRDRLVPVRKWDFGQIAAYGESFLAPGDRKITLNFALAAGAAADAAVLLRHFDPARYLIKITPLNPTYAAAANGLRSCVNADRPGDPAAATALRAAGYEVLVSVGAPEESRIGSNCGQLTRRHLAATAALPGGYTYAIAAARK